MIRLVVFVAAALSIISFASYLGDNTASVFGAIVGNKYASGAALVIGTLAGAIVLGGVSASSLRGWSARAKAHGGFKKLFAKLFLDSEPAIISIAGRLQAVALVLLWLVGAFAAFRLAITNPSFMEKGGGALVASSLIGWGAILASLNAYLAVSVKAEDDRRKDHRDLKNRRRNTVLLIEHMARKMLPRATKVRSLLMLRKRESLGDEDGDFIVAKNLVYLEISTPPQLDKLWDALALVPRELADALRDFTMYVEEYQRLLSDRTRTDPKVQYLIALADLIECIDGLDKAIEKMLLVADQDLAV